MQESDREELELRGREVIRLDGLQPWGPTVKLFNEQRRGKVLGWLEQGVKSEEQEWWQRVYPQLLWEKEGPLAQQR